MTAPEARPGIVLVIDGIAVGVGSMMKIRTLDIRGVARGTVTVSTGQDLCDGPTLRPTAPDHLAAAKRAAFGPRRARWA